MRSRCGDGEENVLGGNGMKNYAISAVVKRISWIHSIGLVGLPYRHI